MIEQALILKLPDNSFTERHTQADSGKGTHNPKG